MSGRPSTAVTLAVRMVQRGSTMADAARKHGVAASSIRRALYRAGEPKMPPGRPLKAAS